MLRHPCVLGGPQTKGDKIRIGCLTPAFSGPKRGRKCYVTRDKIKIGGLTPAFQGAQKRVEMLHHPCILGGAQTKRDKIRIGCLTPAFQGAQFCPFLFGDPRMHG